MQPNLEDSDNPKNDILTQSQEDWEEYPSDIKNSEKDPNFIYKTWNSFRDFMDGENGQS